VSIPDGFGLGLFSARSLANALGLAVSLHSHGERGTEFRLLLQPADTLPAAHSLECSSDHPGAME
jgi:signal transduction histidine kinase